MEVNFISFELCDNDFSMALLYAMQYLVEIKTPSTLTLDKENLEFFFKEFVIFYSETMKFDKKHYIESNTRDYIEKNLKVVYHRDKPTFDHDWGSLVLDLNSNLGNYWLQ